MHDFKVLLVDDEEDFVQSLSDRLDMRDMKPEVAMSGQQALDKLDEVAPTVMILDLKMPGMDGLEVLKKVKSAYPETQVIILTGHGTDQARKEAEKIGAFAYLQKPVEMDTLVSTMTKAHNHFKKVKHSVDTALMVAAIAQTGEIDLARQVGQEEMEDE